MLSRSDARRQKGHSGKQVPFLAGTVPNEFNSRFCGTKQNDLFLLQFEFHLKEWDGMNSHWNEVHHWWLSAH